MNNLSQYLSSIVEQDIEYLLNFKDETVIHINTKNLRYQIVNFEEHASVDCIVILNANYSFDRILSPQYTEYISLK